MNTREQLLDDRDEIETAPEREAAFEGGTKRASLPQSSPALSEARHVECDEVLALRATILSKLTYAVGREPEIARDHDWFVATALAVRDRVIDCRAEAVRRPGAANRKWVYYFSLEFLIGRLLFDCLGNLGLTEQTREALAALGVDLDRIRAVEPDAALGNGGLGRLAACFMESMATLGVPAFGYGIRYDYGLFRQVITDGWQHELPEDWLSFGNPWEFERPDLIYPVGFGGRVEATLTPEGGVSYTWHPAETVRAVAFDTLIPGFRGHHLTTLRLWSARAADPLQLETFNLGDYVGALAGRARVEAISRVLYPSDATPAGHELRLRQEFFFTSASLQDLVRRHLLQNDEIRTLGQRASIQLNDTHPAIAVAELMRILVDLHAIGWDDAWRITTRTLGYTNHTLLPEALESWPITLLERLLPRHMQIIYAINSQHLGALRASERADDRLLASVSLIDESDGRRVRMGHLAFLGSRRVNGVSALHTELMRKTVFRDLHALYPDRIVNKTNGINFRRWLHQANPGLTRLLVETVGEAVLDDPGFLENLAPLAGDRALQERFATQRHANKVALAGLIAGETGIAVDPSALFDVQIKRIHEYKRQLLNILEAVALFRAIKSQPTRDWVPRVKIFAGKAAPSYVRAKLIIKLANDVARVVNSDPVAGPLLKVVFVPNYSVSRAEAIIPAADLSEQISTAGMEASGTGNMKLALNGALTIGTLDGANVEISERIGPDNIFIFGLTAAEVEATRRLGLDCSETVAASPTLADALDAVSSGVFSPDEPGRYRELVESLTNKDDFLVIKDFDAYWQAQRSVDERWRDPFAWWRSSILSTARTGWFSSDRTIREYAAEVWNVPLA